MKHHSTLNSLGSPSMLSNTHICVHLRNILFSLCSGTDVDLTTRKRKAPPPDVEQEDGAGGAKRAKQDETVPH